MSSCFLWRSNGLEKADFHGVEQAAEFNTTSGEVAHACPFLSLIASTSKLLFHIQPIFKIPET